MAWLSFFGKSRKTGGVDHGASMEVVKTAIKTRQYVTVTFPNAPEERRRSFFVGVNEGPESGFYIDLMTPDVSARELEPGRTLAVIRCSVGGAPHEIRAVYAGKENFGGFPSLRFHPPVSVENLQRREFFRVAPKGNEPVDLAIQNGLNESARALDISLGGVRFQTSSQAIPGEVFELTMTIPGAPSAILNTTGHVRECSQTNVARNSKTAKPYCVRVEFDKIDDRSAHSLNKYLFSRQRELTLVSS